MIFLGGSLPDDDAVRAAPASEQQKAALERLLQQQAIQERNQLVTSVAMNVVVARAVRPDRDEGEEPEAKKIAAYAFRVAKAFVEERVKHMQLMPDSSAD